MLVLKRLCCLFVSKAKVIFHVKYIYNSLSTTKKVLQYYSERFLLSFLILVVFILILEFIVFFLFLEALVEALKVYY